MFFLLLLYTLRVCVLAETFPNGWNYWNGWNRLRCKRLERSAAVELFERFERASYRSGDEGRLA
jgi:hypothetical protein